MKTTLHKDASVSKVSCKKAFNQPKMLITSHTIGWVFMILIVLSLPYLSLISYSLSSLFPIFSVLRHHHTRNNQEIWTPKEN